MDQLACPKNTKARAASLIANSHRGKTGEIPIPDLVTPIRPKRATLNHQVVTIDFQNCGKRDHDSESDSDATPMTRISKKVISTILVFITEDPNLAS